MSDPEIVIGDRGTLTAREAEAVLWVAQGNTSWEAGRILGVSEHTLSTHVVNASTKLAATNRAHLVARAFVSGVLRVHRCLVLMLLSAAIFFAQEAGRRPPRIPRRTREDAEVAAQAVA